MPSLDKIHPELTSPEQFSFLDTKSYDFEYVHPWPILCMGFRAMPAPDVILFVTKAFLVMIDVWEVLFIANDRQDNPLQSLMCHNPVAWILVRHKGLMAETALLCIVCHTSILEDDQRWQWSISNTSGACCSGQVGDCGRATAGKYYIADVRLRESRLYKCWKKKTGSVAIRTERLQSYF